MMQTRPPTRSLLAKEDADKLAKKDFASSQSDYQKIDTVTSSKAPMMEPEISKMLHQQVHLALSAEQNLKKCPGHRNLLTLRSLKKSINHLAQTYKHTGHLPSDWKYHPDTASSSAPINCPLVPDKKKPKVVPRISLSQSKDPMMEEKLDLPEILFNYVEKARDTELDLMTRPNDEGLLSRLNYFKEKIGSLNELYQGIGGDWPSCWKYHDTASSCVAIEYSLVPGCPHIDSAPLVGEPAKAAQLNFKKLDKKLNKADKLAKKGSASSQSDYLKTDRVTRSKAPMMEQKLEIPLVGESAKAAQLSIKKLDKKLIKADKLAKKGSASSQSDYLKTDRVTRSKAPMMEQKLEIPENLYACINECLETEQKLKKCTSDEGLQRRLKYLEESIVYLAELYKEFGDLPDDWEYHPDTASSYVPKCHLVSPKKKPKAKAARCNYKKLDDKFKADKLNHSASSQSDYQKIDRVTPSKEARELEIPQPVYVYIKRALDTEQELKKCPSNECLQRDWSIFKQKIDITANMYIARGLMPSGWKYNPSIASSYVPISCDLVPAVKKIKMDIPRNPHIDSARLKNKREKAVWQNFKELDRTFKKITHKGLPIPTDEKYFTQLDANHEFVTFIRDFAVRIFNESCQMYRNNNKNIKNITKAKVKECKYLKVQPCYLFYMTIEAVEQGKSGAYEINLQCNLDDGAIVLDSFCLKGPEALGMREGALISLESIYKTVKDALLTDPEVCYSKSGMVRRTGGYDFYNPCGWDSLYEWDDLCDEEWDD